MWVVTEVTNYFPCIYGPSIYVMEKEPNVYFVERCIVGVVV